MYTISDCEDCGAPAILYVIRMNAAGKYRLARHNLADCLRVELESKDILAAYCTQCGLPVDIEWEENERPAAKTAKR